MRQLANRLRPLAPRWAAHFIAASRMVISPGKPWKRQLMNVQQATRDFSLHMLEQAKQMEEAISSGSDMLRIPYDAKLASAALPEDEATEMEAFAQAWLTRAGLPTGSAAFFRTCAESSTLHPQILASSDALAAEEHFAHAYIDKNRCDPNDPERHIFTVEDEDPAILWRQGWVAGITRWILKLSMSKRWEIFHVPEASLIAFYRTWCNASLPRSLRPQLHDVQLDHLPYLYHTVKQKCHNGSGG